MTVYTTPDPQYPDEDEFLSDGDSYFTGKKMIEWDDAAGKFLELTQPDGT